MDGQRREKREVGGRGKGCREVTKKKKKSESHIQGPATAARDRASMASPFCGCRSVVISQDCAERSLAVARS